MSDWDVLVLGAGPSGLAAALTAARVAPRARIRLVDAGRMFTKRICPVDRGRACNGCGGSCNVISGFGGSIHYGDGVKISQFPSGRRLAELLGDSSASVNQAEALRLLIGDRPINFVRPDLARLGLRLEHMEGVSAKSYPVAALSDHQVKAMVEGLFAQVQTSRGIEFSHGASAVSLTRCGEGFLTEIRHGRADEVERIVSRYVVVATGRKGMLWWREQLRTLGIRHSRPIASLGVRLEFPSALLRSVAETHPDYKMSFQVGDKKLKTFCFCVGSSGGRIKFTDYGPFTLLDGHVIEDTGVAGAGNFALLVQLKDTSGRALTFDDIRGELLESYFALRTDSPGRPVAQWAPDFLADRAPEQSFDALPAVLGFTPSVRDLQTAHLSSAIGACNHKALSTGIRQLIQAFADTSGDDLERLMQRFLVVGIELEGLWDEIELSPRMETSEHNLFCVGDNGGLAQGILQATISGLVAGREIASRLTSTDAPQNSCPTQDQKPTIAMERLQ